MWVALLVALCGAVILLWGLWQSLREVAFAVLATGTAGLGSFWWYQRRKGALLQARRRLIEASTTCVEQRSLENILTSLPAAESGTGSDAEDTGAIADAERERILGPFVATSGRLGRQLGHEWAQNELVRAWQTEPGRLLDNMRLDLWRDRIFGETSFGRSGDQELAPPTGDMLVEWPRLLETARMARELDRSELLHACLRAAEAAIALALYVDRDVLSGLCELLAAERDPDLQLRLGLVHYAQVCWYEATCQRARDDGRCTGCPRTPAPVEVRAGAAITDVREAIDETFVLG